MSKNSTRRTWTSDQKREIAAEVRRRRSRKETFRSISTELGINEGSLRLWLDQFLERSLQSVTVLDARMLCSEIALFTPDGFRFAGLDLETAVQLLERIR